MNPIQIQNSTNESHKTPTPPTTNNPTFTITLNNTEKSYPQLMRKTKDSNQRHIFMFKNYKDLKTLAAELNIYIPESFSSFEMSLHTLANIFDSDEKDLQIQKTGYLLLNSEFECNLCSENQLSIKPENNGFNYFKNYLTNFLEYYKNQDMSDMKYYQTINDLNAAIAEENWSLYQEIVDRLNQDSGELAYNEFLRHRYYNEAEYDINPLEMISAEPQQISSDQKSDDYDLIMNNYGSCDFDNSAVIFTQQRLEKGQNFREVEENYTGISTRLFTEENEDVNVSPIQEDFRQLINTKEAENLKLVKSFEILKKDSEDKEAVFKNQYSESLLMNYETLKRLLQSVQHLKDNLKESDFCEIQNLIENTLKINLENLSTLNHLESYERLKKTSEAVEFEIHDQDLEKSDMDLHESTMHEYSESETEIISDYDGSSHLSTDSLEENQVYQDLLPEIKNLIDKSTGLDHQIYSPRNLDTYTHNNSLLIQNLAKALKIPDNEIPNIKFHIDDISINDIDLYKNMPFLPEFKLSYVGFKLNSLPIGYGKLVYIETGITCFVGDFFDGGAHGKWVDIYYPNSKLCFEGEMCKGKFHGYGKIYHESGLLDTEGWFNKGLLTSKSVRVYNYNGSEVQTRLYHVNGNLKYKGQFDKNLRHGYGHENWSNGNKRSEGYWVFGKFEGKLQKQFDRQGNIWFIGSFIDGKKDGFCSEFHGNGAIRYEGNYKADRYHTGLGKVYNEQGLIEYIGEIKEGKYINGFGEIYHTSDDITDIDNKKILYFKGEIKNGGPHAKLAEIFDKDGNLRYIGQMVEGIKQGMGKLYSPNGKLKYNGYFMNNGIHGENISVYDEDGWIEFCGNMHEGKIVQGISKEYTYIDTLTFKGTISYRPIFNGGMQKKSTFGLKKQMVYIGEYLNYKRHGKNVKEFNKNGNLEYHGSMNQGYREGFGKLYHNNGVLKYEGFFKKGEIDGVCVKIFDYKGKIEYQGLMEEGLKEHEIMDDCVKVFDELFQLGAWSSEPLTSFL